MSKNTSPSPQPPSPTPKFVWPRPGQDLPRLPWADWLRLHALELGSSFPGDLGFFLSQQALALAEHAKVLGAHSPTNHIALAQRAADLEAAWVASLEAESEQPGHWVPTIEEYEPETARRAWLEIDFNGATYRN